MLSNSNVFVLLILIKHFVLLELTSANLLAVNAYVNIDDTKSYTVETVTTPLSHVGQPFIEDSQRASITTATTTTTTTTTETSAHIRLITDNVKATTLTKAPLVTGSSEQFPTTTNEADNDNINDDDDVDNDDSSNDDANPNIQLLPQSDAPSISNSTSTDIATDPHLELLKPRSDAVYFIVAVIGGAKIWARTLARTLHEMGPPFGGDPLGSPLRPIYVDLPTNGR